MRFPFSLTRDKSFDCLGFGENTSDFLLLAPNFPKPDTKTALVEDVQTSGGQIASTLVGLARLGLKTAYAGRFGGDDAGTRGRESLSSEAVDLSFAETIEGARTHTSYIVVDATTGERTILFSRDERLAYKQREAPIEAASLARLLHIDAQNAEASLELIKAARRARAIVSADFDFINRDVLALLPHVDVLITSQNFPRQAVEIEDEKLALKELNARYGCRIVGQTKGERGAIMLIENSFIETPALPVPEGVRDTTGAGDAFHAGFLYGLLMDETIEDALKIAAAVAALSCRSLGARAGLPTKRELEEYL